nr:hypothetical protein [Bacillus sp. FJAT-22090]
MKAVLSQKRDLSFQSKLKDFMWDTLYGNNPNSFIKMHIKNELGNVSKLIII